MDKKIYIIKKSENGDTKAEIKDQPLFKESEQKDWTIQAITEVGIDSYLYKAEPGAIFPMHTAPDTYMGLVLDGSGTIELGNSEGKEISRIILKKGDFIILNSNTNRSWKIDKEGILLFFVKGEVKS